MSEHKIRQIFAEAAAVQSVAADRCAGAIGAAVDSIERAVRNGGKVVVFGNGGSAADSQHFAAELVGRFRINRRPLAAIALTTDTSVITSIANDFAYDRVFERQLEAIGRRGDVALAISTSGRSPSVIKALAHAKRQALTTIALVGLDTSEIEALADISISVPATNVARIQEAHRTALHIICELVEARLAGDASAG